MSDATTDHEAEEETPPPDTPPDAFAAWVQFRADFRQKMQEECRHFKLNKPDPAIHRDLARGWLSETHLQFDFMFWGRWEYWAQIAATFTLPPQPIPRMHFLDTPDKQTRKMLTTCLDAIPNHGTDSWLGWSSFDYFRYFLDWLLWGFGHPGQKEAPRELAGCEGASDRLYQIFNIGMLLLWPHDYLGDLLGENRHGRQNGFYATPHTLVEFMVRTLAGEATEGGEEMRLKSVLDPCVGTGRMLLHASNHCLHLYGMDIDATMCNATLVNGYLYAPWLVKPLTCLPREPGAATSPLPPDVEVDTEESFQFAPIYKGKRKTSDPAAEIARQGLLF